MIEADNCSDIGNLTPAQIEAKSCNGGFLSNKNQRDSVYNGDDSPRLWTGEAARHGDVINTASINKPPSPRTGPTVTGYVGTLRVEYAPDPKDLGVDVSNIKATRGETFDTDEKTTLNFDKVDLAYFLKQVLGGVLGVNYSAPDDVQGKVSFYTEQPIPKGQVLQVVRDILARNGYEMRYLSGIYQIGKPEAIAAMATVATSGRAGEQVTRIIKVRKGSTTEIAAFVKELAGDDVSLSSANGGDSIILHAPPTEIDRVADLIQSLSDGGVGDDRVAIIPLHQASPQHVAATLADFYKDRLSTNKADSVTVIPLERQQALLIGTRDKRMMAGIRQLIDQLDREGSDEVALRAIPLVNLQSDDIVQQLNSVFGDKNSASTGPSKAPPAAAPRPGSAPAQPTQPATSTDDIASANPDGPSPPSMNPRQPAPSKAAAGPDKGAQPVMATGDGGLKIVSDVRNNAVLVYSSYTMFVRIKEFLKAVDVPQAQVVIEATIAEVDITDSLQYGVEAYLQANGLMVARSGTDITPTTPTTAGGAIQAHASIGNVRLDAVLTALQSVTKVKVISSPYLTVVDGKTAHLTIGDQIPFANRTVNSTTTGTATVTQEVETKDTGIVLEVTPKIHSDNSVLLNVDQTVSKPDNSALTGNNLTPVISTREVKSDVIVQSGRTILIGGLIQDRLDKIVTSVPVLGKLPVVGDLFSQKSDTSTRVELIIMITPRVIRRSNDIENITRQLRTQVGIR